MKRNISVLMLILLALTLAACAPAATQPAADGPKTPQALQPTAISGALFQVILPDGSSVGITLDQLKSLPLAQLTVDGKTEEGPKLMDILTLAGVTDFSEVSLTGSSAPVTLTREQVDDNTILDFNNHGTLKLSTTYVPKADWTKDISTITVK
ncbi:MAG: hypothetical protein HY869_22010 [Chloroflexi bacterium]|nr:hypothetical protein [Chloroflexota bacterium]